MSDIDDELLALAGGDSEDEGSPSRLSSASPPPRSKKTPAPKAKARPKNDDSEDEGEA